MKPVAPRHSFDAIMAEAIANEPRSKTKEKIGVYCIALKGLMQADEARRERLLKAVKKVAVVAKPKRAKATGKRKAVKK